MITLRPHVTAALLATLTVLPRPTAAATPQGGVVARATVETQKATPDHPARVELTLTGEWLSQQSKLDLYLVLDESGSIDTVEWRALTDFAARLVESLPSAGFADGTLRVGILQFNGSANTVLPASSARQQILDTLRNAVSRSGPTNHAAAVRATLAAAQARGDRRAAMVMVTDGSSNQGVNDLGPACAAADAAGLERFVVGVGQGISRSGMALVASTPVEKHMFAVNAFAALTPSLQALMAAVQRPGGTSIVVRCPVKAPLEADDVAASAGAATLDGRTIVWNVAELGGTTAKLSFQVRPGMDTRGGPTDVFDGIAFADAEGHQVTWPRLRVFMGGRPDQIRLTPEQATQATGAERVFATQVLDGDSAPVGDVPLVLEVQSGPHAGTTLMGTTDAQGNFAFRLTGHAPGQDRVWVRTLRGADVRSNIVPVTWTGAAQATPPAGGDQQPQPAHIVADAPTTTPTPSKPPAPPTEMDYLVVVKTSNIRKAGTDSNVDLVIRGAGGQTAAVRLNRLRDQGGHRNFFEQGKTETFLLPKQRYVGTVTGVSITFDDSGLSSDWHLETISVQEHAAGKTGKWSLPIATWLTDRKTYSFVVRG
ncbi:MAG: VWA domain-containing protein [Planctomycetota bacterium]